MKHDTDCRTSATATTSQEVDYFRIASEFYLSEILPQDYMDMDDEDFYDFLEENAWEPFMYYSGEDLQGAITGLSYRMERIAREARKKTLDEVKAKLNIK